MIRNRVRALMILLATLVVPATMLATVSPASAAPALSGAASQPQGAAAGAQTASPSTGNTCGGVADAAKVYLQNSPSAHIGVDTKKNDDIYAAISPHLVDDEMFDFIKVGSASHGDPIFELEVVSGNVLNCGKCPASTGGYLEYKTCNTNGTYWIERPAGNGFHLENNYVVRTSGKAEYMTAPATDANDRLLLASLGTDWQLWNAI